MTHKRLEKKRLAQPLLWLLLLLSLGACGLGAIPIPDATPTPCPGNCPPPARDNSQPQSAHFACRRRAPPASPAPMYRRRSG
ncbi:MAG TPA: hypothetical protein VFY89_03345, partial [Ktedonobacterales bacterium]